MRILTVCLGNICRSPTAEAAIREAARGAGVEVEVDSAGTAAYHVGEPPDPRMRAAGEQAGLHIDGSARRVTRDDLDSFDLVVTMDASNLADVRRLAPDDGHRARIVPFRSFADTRDDGSVPDVPDPYYGDRDGFAEVVEIARRNARALIDAVAAGRLDT
jgi:protein-tyrosine phosphatase